MVIDSDVLAASAAARPGRVDPEPADHGVGTTTRPGRATRIGVAGGGLALMVGGLVLAAPVLVLCGAVLGVTSLLLRRFPLDLALPLGALLSTAAAAAAGIAASATGTSLLAHPLAIAALFVVGTLVAVLDSLRGPAAPAHARSRATWIAYLPALLAVGNALVQSVNGRVAMTWSFVGTDLAQHLLMLKEVQRTGALDYAADGYPRAFQMVLALVAAPGMPHGSQSSLLDFDLRLMAATIWLALALVLATAATVALRLGVLLGTSRTVAIVAATAAATGLLMSNSFIGTFVYMGAAPSLLAMVALWVLPLTAMDLGRDGARRLLPLLAVACALVALLANLWQALVLVPPAAVLATLLVRRPITALLHGRSRPTAGSLTAAVLVVLTTLAVAAAPLLGIQHAGGVALAATPGEIPAAPAPAIVVGLLSLGWLLRHWGQAGARALVGAAVGVVATACVLLLGSGRTDTSQYYVVKSLWFLTVLLLPLLALAVAALAAPPLALGWHQLARLGALAKVVRVTVVACAVAAFVALALPVLVISGSSALDTVGDQTEFSTSSRDYGFAVGYATRYSPAVTVPVEVGSGLFLDPVATKVTSKLLSFLTGQPTNMGQPKDVCADVRAVAGTRHAVVITTLEPAVLTQIMDREGCGDVPVVRLPGPHRKLLGPADTRLTAPGSRA